MGEQWKESRIPEYYVSNLGRLSSGKHGKMRMLRICKNPQGYLRITIRECGTNKTWLIHRLVADAFVGPAPTPRHEVNHKNGVPTDNSAENLEWVTRSENLFHRNRVLGRKAVRARGAESHASRLGADDVEGIRAMRSGGATFRAIAEKYGCCPQNVHAIVSGKTWATR